MGKHPFDKNWQTPFLEILSQFHTSGRCRWAGGWGRVNNYYRRCGPPECAPCDQERWCPGKGPNLSDEGTSFDIREGDWDELGFTGEIISWTGPHPWESFLHLLPGVKPVDGRQIPPFLGGHQQLQQTRGRQCGVFSQSYLIETNQVIIIL